AITGPGLWIDQRDRHALSAIGDHVVPDPHQRVVAMDDGIGAEAAPGKGPVGVALDRLVRVAAGVPEFHRVGAEEDQIVAQDRYPNDLVRRGFCIGEGQAVYRADVIQGGPIEGPGPVLCEVPAPRVESEAAGDRKIGIRDLVESGAIMPPDGARRGVHHADLRTRSVDFAAARRSAQSADGGALIVKGVSADAQRVPIEDAIDLVHGADGGGGNGRILDQRRTWDQGAWKWP